MVNSNRVPSSSRSSPRGFALVVTVIMLTLLTILALGLISLSTIQLRGVSRDLDRQVARANARLALMQAVGQLQKNLGPDQRVSAPASVLGENGQDHWTGVWASTRRDGKSYWGRIENGSLFDSRFDDGWEREDEVRAWLVSGSAKPGDDLPAGSSIELVGAGSVGDDKDARVRAPLLRVEVGGAGNGRMAWWTGDLGTRANLAVRDVHGDDRPNPKDPTNGGYNRLLASQGAAGEVMGEGIGIRNSMRSKLASNKTVSLAAANGNEWSQKHFHDFTVNSKGVISNVRDGGLKKDLTAYFESDGVVAPLGKMAGLRDEDSLIVNPEKSRYGIAGPRFGLLREWAQAAIPFSGKDVASRIPDSDAAGGVASAEYSLCNAVPTRLKKATKASLQPILVEASSVSQLSVYEYRTEVRADGVKTPVFQWRVHMYPRVVLWNPYNVELDFEPAMVMIQGNGRQEVWSEDIIYDSKGQETAKTRENQWLFFEGGRSTSFQGSILQSKGYNDPYIGSYYYQIPATKFGPGECLVFSPARSAEYDGLSVYRPGAYNLANNLLSCEVAPDATRSFYISASELEGGFKDRPVRFWYQATPRWSADGRNGIENQSDDTRVVMKALNGASEVSFEQFDQLPQLTYLSASIQYGAGREPRIAWDGGNRMPIELLSKENPTPRIEPDVRTRDGIRMRWFHEHLSNLTNAGALTASPEFFEEAPLANWNPRAAYIMRSPWENLGGTMPSAGSGGGPWFFGLYTRDLFDFAVSWIGQVPIFRDGRYHGNPFGPPQEGLDRYIVFELPRSETGLVSMGQFQNTKLSDFVWHPSSAIGNSLVDPRLGLEQMNGTIPPSPSNSEDAKGGFHRNAIGYSRDKERSENRDDWANTGRALLQDIPGPEHVVYDLSFEVNHALWDNYYLSSGDRAAKKAWLEKPNENPLPNGRMMLASAISGSDKADEVSDYHRSAAHLMINGAFNVNSTSVEAWKAMLASTRASSGNESTPFARILASGGDPFKSGDLADDDNAWSGFRELSDDDIDRLASAIVEEVKERGPFLCMSDFVNRRLANDETGKKGALQAAIDRAGINVAFEETYVLNNDHSIIDYDHPENIRDATRLEQTLKPDTKAWGASGFLTQGDVLQVLAPVLSVRSDSFVIRAYGDSSDESGSIRARAWCEAVVQRTPEPLRPDLDGLNPVDAGTDRDFGRRFEVVAFRWLEDDEV